MILCILITLLHVCIQQDAKTEYFCVLSYCLFRLFVYLAVPLSESQNGHLVVLCKEHINNYLDYTRI